MIAKDSGFSRVATDEQGLSAPAGKARLEALNERGPS